MRLLLSLALLLLSEHAFAQRDSVSSAGSSSSSSPESQLGQYPSWAAQCGLTVQAQFVPENQGGDHRCGEAVKNMVQCYAKNALGKTGCNAQCGNGKDFVNCNNDALKNCGYTRESPSSPLCEAEGAIIAFDRGSNSAEGQVDGHVEFVCGPHKYCSINHITSDQPMHSQIDGCWAPDNAHMPFGAASTPTSTSSGATAGQDGGGYGGNPMNALFSSLFGQSYSASKSSYSVRTPTPRVPAYRLWNAPPLYQGPR